jgi:hypothetical protein
MIKKVIIFHLINYYFISIAHALYNTQKYCVLL